MASIRKLEATDDVSGFRSGHGALDAFLHRFAALNQFVLHTGVTYLAVERAEIVGYVTVAAAEALAADFAGLRRRKVPRYPLPMLRIARLAVAEAWQRKGIGNGLVRHAFGLALRMTHEIGCAGVVVDPKQDSVEYYRRLGFESKVALEGHDRQAGAAAPMFLSIETIKHAVGKD